MKMKKSILIISILIFVFNSCKEHDDNNKLQNGIVVIKGTIVDYKGIYKTGKLDYFNAVTRIINNEIFEIDSAGNFEVAFELPHPIIGSIFFDIENQYYSDFYIEPNKNYDISIDNNSLIFNGKTGKNNNDIAAFKDSLYKKLGAKNRKAELLHTEGLSIDEYLSFMKEIEKENIDFLIKYNNEKPFAKKIFKVLESEIRYKTAHAWINYKYDYSTPGTRILRDSLPPNFYKNLFKEYPVAHEEDYQSRICIDYISNIVTSIEQKGTSLEKRIEFFNLSNYFSPKQIELIAMIFSGDKEISESEDYKEFNTQENMAKMRELYMRYNLNSLLDDIPQYTQNIGRNLVITQAVSRYYISNNIRPTTSEWERIRNLINDKSIWEYLQVLSTQKTTEKNLEKIENKFVKKSIEEVKTKYLDKYLGKVVYIDFYSTWCGPCREEIPYAKALHSEFKNSDVVFLNLCANSEKENWENLIKQKKIEGENYLLNNEEFNLLAKLYKVNGFPTYILIDKKGNVADYSAPRPSSKQSIMEALNKLTK